MILKHSILGWWIKISIIKLITSGELNKFKEDITFMKKFKFLILFTLLIIFFGCEETYTWRCEITISVGNTSGYAISDAVVTVTDDTGNSGTAYTSYKGVATMDYSFNTQAIVADGKMFLHDGSIFTEVVEDVLRGRCRSNLSSLGILDVSSPIHKDSPSPCIAIALAVLRCIAVLISIVSILSNGMELFR